MASHGSVSGTPSAFGWLASRTPKLIGDAPVTNHKDQSNDPYAPPPRYREKSGAMLRVVILAALLAGAAWGYMQFANAPQTALVEPAAEEQVMADARDAATPYQTQAPDVGPAAPANPANAATLAPRTPSRAAPADSVPPPTTTTEPSAPPQPLPPADMPSGG